MSDLKLEDIMKAVSDIAQKETVAPADVEVLKSQISALADTSKEVELLKSQLETISDEISKGKYTMSNKDQTPHFDLNKSFRAAAKQAMGGDILEKGLTSEANSGEATLQDSYSAEIIKELIEVHPFFSVVNFVSHQSAGFKNTVNIGGSAARWAGENTDNSETGNTDASAYKSISAVYGKLEAKPFVTNEMVRDAAYDVVADLKSDVADEFGLSAVSASLVGNGIDKPMGIFSQTASVATYNKFGKTVVAAEALATAELAKAELRKIFRSVKSTYRVNGVWLMSSETRDFLASLVDVNGRSLIDDNIAEAPEGRVLGKEIIIEEDVPAMTLSFGNHKKAFTVIAVQGLEVIEDKVTRPSNTQYYHAQTFGSVVNDTKAIVVVELTA